MRKFSAFVDNKPKFINQADLLVWSLVEFGKVDVSQIVLHVAEGVTADALPYSKWLGVELVATPSWPGLPYCNKVMQVTEGDFGGASEVILLDCDVLVARPIPRINAVIAGKLAEGGPLSPQQLREMFADAGVRTKFSRADLRPDIIPSSWFNGGLYFFKTEILDELRDEWPHWVNWLTNYAPLSMFGQHFDELALALAIGNKGWSYKRLGREYNFPVHRATPFWKDRNPRVLHYHDHFAKSGRLRKVPTNSFIGAYRANLSVKKINQGLPNFVAQIS